MRSDVGVLCVVDFNSDSMRASVSPSKACDWSTWRCMANWLDICYLCDQRADCYASYASWQRVIIPVMDGCAGWWNNAHAERIVRQCGAWRSQQILTLRRCPCWLDYCCTYLFLSGGASRCACIKENEFVIRLDGTSCVCRGWLACVEMPRDDPVHPTLLMMNEWYDAVEELSPFIES